MVDYNDPAEPWHERGLLAAVGDQRNTFAIVTPDHDVYLEELYPDPNGDIGAMRICGLGSALPFGVAAADTYRFGAPLPNIGPNSALRAEGRLLFFLFRSPDVFWWAH